MIAYVLNPRRIGPVRGLRVERALAELATSRSARILAEAADAVLAASAAGDLARGAAALAETLLQKAAVQDLLMAEGGNPVDLGDRIGALAVGLFDAARDPCSIRVVAPRARVCAQGARWLTAVSLGLVEGFAADLNGGGTVTVRLDVRAGSVVVSAVAEPADRSGPIAGIDGARLLVAYMGGRLRERIDGDRRSAVVTLPRLLSAQVS